MQFSLYQNSMVISSVLNCKSVNADGGHLDLTLILLFWKIEFLVSR